MRRIVLIHAALSALLLPASTQAQGFEAPVLYENDFLSADFHRSRRDAVRAALPPDAIAVLFGAPQRNRSNDVDYEYRQSSDFLYLTGTTEPGSALILAPSGITVDGLRVQEVLFVPPRDPAQEVWEGRRFGTSRAMEQLGVEMALEATAACLINSITFNAARLGIDTSGLEISVRSTVDPRVLFAVKEPTEHKACMGTIEYDVKVHGDVSDEDIQTIRDYCAYSPVHGMMAESVNISGNVSKAN